MQWQTNALSRDVLNCIIALLNWSPRFPFMNLTELMEEVELDCQSAFPVMIGDPIPPKPDITTFLFLFSTTTSVTFPSSPQLPAPTLVNGPPAPVSWPRNSPASVICYLTPPSELLEPEPVIDVPEPGPPAGALEPPCE